MINTQSAVELNRIRALLSEDLRAKVISRADYEALYLQAEVLRWDTQDDLCRVAQIKPQIRAISLFRAKDEAKLPMFSVRNDRPVSAYQAQLDSIMAGHSTEAAASVAVHTADGGVGALGLGL